MNKKNNASAGLNAAQLMNYVKTAQKLYKELPEIRRKFNEPFFGGPSIQQIERELSESKKQKSNPPRKPRPQAAPTRRVAAPVAFGSQVSQSHVRLQGRPQILTDVSGNTNFEGVRCEFSDVLGTQVGTSADEGIVSNLYPALTDDTGSPSRIFEHITPTSVSYRLGAIGMMYEFYAFRSITFEYVPYDATSTRGSVLMGFIRDVLSLDPAQVDMRYVMETEGSNCTTVWSPNKVTLTFKGTKVWNCLNGKGEIFTPTPARPEEYIQSLLICGVAGTSVAAATLHGWFRTSGVCDFYRATPIIKDGVGSFQNQLSSEVMQVWLETAVNHKLNLKDWLLTDDGKEAVGKVRKLFRDKLDQLIPEIEED
jgi:hypothetical protein